MVRRFWLRPKASSRALNETVVYGTEALGYSPELPGRAPTRQRQQQEQRRKQILCGDDKPEKQSESRSPAGMTNKKSKAKADPLRG
jgi:hypothetical protein